MKIRVDRINETKNSTLGNFFINDVRQCYTLEDDGDKIKVPGETRIPAGTYPVELRHEGGFYNKYSKRFKEDHPMLTIRDVPGYEFILIHIGNYHKDTAGCVLVGETFDMQEGDYLLLKSVKAYKKIYYPIHDAIALGEKVTIEIGDTISNKTPEKTIPYKKLTETESPKLPIWKKNGFKRVIGFAVGLGGLVLKMIPDTAILGEIVMYAGGSLGIIGVGDSLKKNREKDSDTYVDRNKVLRYIAELIIKLIKQYLKKKGK